MITTKLILVVTITLAAVILFNIAIFVRVKRSRGPRQSAYLELSRVARRARNPWEVENARIEALSRQVAALKSEPPAQAPDHQTFGASQTSEVCETSEV